MKIVTAEQMRSIDRKAITEYGIPGIVLMENAGIRTVELIEELLQSPSDKQVIILSGPGNNGGDGFVIARHLINSGVEVILFFRGTPDQLTDDARINYEILVKMEATIAPLQTEEDLNQFTLALLTGDLFVDALYGAGFKGSLNAFETQIASVVNWCKLPVVAVDIPSGVEADSGKVNGEAIRADYTVTFGLPKMGLIMEPGRYYTGT